MRARQGRRCEARGHLWGVTGACMRSSCPAVRPAPAFKPEPAPAWTGLDPERAARVAAHAARVAANDAA